MNQRVLCYDQKWWKLKYLSRILTDLHWTFRTGLVFLSWSKWVQAVVCYDQNWWKLKYLSGISIDLHWQIFWVVQLFLILSHRSGSKWPTMANFATEVAWISSKWAILVKFQQNLKYLSRISTDLHRTFRTGLIFLSQSKWVQEVLCYGKNW